MVDITQFFDNFQIQSNEHELADCCEMNVLYKTNVRFILLIDLISLKYIRNNLELMKLTY